MPPSHPFLERGTGNLDFTPILVEAIPIAKLIVLVAAVALVPFVFVLLFGSSILGGVFMLLTQFVLAVGSGVVLLYVVSRAIQLADAA